MKKIFALILSLVMMVSFAACGAKKDNIETNDGVKETVGVESTVDENNTENEIVDTDKESDSEKTDEELRNDTTVNNGQTDGEINKNDNSENKDTTETKPTKEDIKPVQKPVDKPVEKPADKPVDKPSEPTSTTIGNTLLSDFKSKASMGMSAEEIANSLLENSVIQFMGGAIPVEEGLLSGFDNFEVKGFDNGVMFAPMIGSIPFVGYVFELKKDTDVSTFISNLEKNANKRWNVCVEADEMVTGSQGNKVFFVMCPASFEE